MRLFRNGVLRVPSTHLKHCSVWRGTAKQRAAKPCKPCEASGEITTRITWGEQ